HKLVIINGKAENGIVEQVYKNKNYGYEISKELYYHESILSDLEKLYQQNKIDEILQANPALPEESNLKLVEFARNKGLKFSFVPNLFEVQRNIIETDNLNGIP